MVLDSIGRQLLAIFRYSIQVFLMIYLSFRATLVDQAQGLRTIFSVVSAQVYFTGWQALPLISTLAAASGAVVVLQSAAQLSKFGGGAMLGQVMISVVVRELGPLITALIVIARSGTAVASEIGNMRAHKETEALEAMGINPLSYIVFPRLVGGVVSVVCLAFYFAMVGLITGFLVVRFTKDYSFAFYFDSLAQALSIEDVLIFLVKNIFSGTIIFVVSCYQGMLVHESPHEVPQVTTKAVVNSIIYVVGFNLTMTLLTFLSQLSKMGVL